MAQLLHAVRSVLSCIDIHRIHTDVRFVFVACLGPLSQTVAATAAPASVLVLLCRFVASIASRRADAAQRLRIGLHPVF